MFTFIIWDVKHRHKTHLHPIHETIKNSFASSVFSMADNSHANSFFHSYIQMFKLTTNTIKVMTKTHQNTQCEESVTKYVLQDSTNNS